MISDDELLLYYYRELEPVERARISAALGEQPELARRLHSLIARLDAAAAMPEVPVPEQVQQRWRTALDGAAQVDRRAAPARRFPTRWLAVAAAVATVALAVSFQMMKSEPALVADDAARAATPDAAGARDDSAYANGLKWHLASTERQIASLGSATPEERARLIEAIIGQNRIYALAADRAGEPQLARVLRAFTPILEDLGSGRSESTASNVAQLSFELRVMQARLSADAQPPANTL